MFSLLPPVSSLPGFMGASLLLTSLRSCRPPPPLTFCPPSSGIGCCQWTCPVVLDTLSNPFPNTKNWMEHMKGGSEVNSASCPLAGIKELCDLRFELQYREKALKPKGKLNMAVKKHVRFKAGLIEEVSCLSRRWRISQLKTPLCLLPYSQLPSWGWMRGPQELNPCSCVLGISLEGCNLNPYHVSNLGDSSSSFSLKLWYPGSLWTWPAHL